MAFEGHRKDEKKLRLFVFVLFFFVFVSLCTRTVFGFLLTRAPPISLARQQDKYFHNHIYYSK
jgi:hypothetical protein